MNDFKSNLKNIPLDIFEKIEALLSEHGLDDVEVTGIDITPLNEVSTQDEGPTKDDCAKKGKKQKCKKKKDGTLKCWCVKKSNIKSK